MNLNQVTLPTADMARSIAFYRDLGLRLIVDSAPRYARFECPDGGATFSLHHVEQAPTESGIVVYFECQDMDERVAELQRRGHVFSSPPTDQSWRWREARLRDPFGNVICLYWAGENRRFPPWRLAEAGGPDVSDSAPSA